MTLTSPESSRPAARRRRLGAWVAAVALALTPLLSDAAAAGQVSVAGDTAGSVSITVAPSGGGLVRAELPLTLTTTVTNTTPSTVAAADVHVAVGRAPLESRTDLEAWLADGTGDGDMVFDELGVTHVDAVAPLDTRTTALTVDPTGTGLASRSPGVYPLRATYASAAGSLTVTSVVVVAPAAIASTGLGLVVPVVAGPLDHGLLTEDELTDLTGPLGVLTEQLDAVTGTSAILAVDPAIPASIRVLGSAAPDDAEAWLARLMALPNQRFALQFGDADLATQVQSGMSVPLAPVTLQSYLDPDDFASVSAGAEPDETPAPTATAETEPQTSLPTLDELTDIGPALPGVLWPATGSAGPDVIAALTAAVPGALTLVPDTTISDDAGPSATADDANLLVYDADLSSALAAVASSDDGVARAAATAEANAYAAVARARSDRPILVVVDRATPSSTGLRSAVATAQSLAGYSPTDLGTVTAADPENVEIAAADPDPTRVDALAQLLHDESQLTAFASILADPAVLTTPERTTLLQLMGNAWRTQPETWSTTVAEHRAGTHETLDAVGISPPSNINLLGGAAPLGFAVRNDLPWPVSLTLTAYPTEPVLVVQNTTAVEAGAEQNTRVEVPVEARVGSGATTIELQLRSPTGVAIGHASSVPVTVRAEWESVWIAVLAAVVGLLLVLGVVRTVLRIRRRGARGTDTADEMDAADGMNPDDPAGNRATPRDDSAADEASR
ncbi:DUF6049 family protein [Microbacterium sp.]|uniref:DUF6049 family protein n=1 Tax=Microbacterium sp. TaxID=51671 RepID=UPI0039E6BADD